MWTCWVACSHSWRAPSSASSSGWTCATASWGDRLVERVLARGGLLAQGFERVRRGGLRLGVGVADARPERRAVGCQTLFDRRGGGLQGGDLDRQRVERGVDALVRLVRPLLEL